jgi:hypothetical protein
VDLDALVMFLVGAIGLWGGLVLAVVKYNRASRRENRS